MFTILFCQVHFLFEGHPRRYSRHQNPVDHPIFGAEPFIHPEKWWEHGYLSMLQKAETYQSSGGLMQREKTIGGYAMFGRLMTADWQVGSKMRGAWGREYKEPPPPCMPDWIHKSGIWQGIPYLHPLLWLERYLIQPKIPRKGIPMTTPPWIFHSVLKKKKSHLTHIEIPKRLWEQSLST